MSELPGPSGAADPRAPVPASPKYTTDAAEEAGQAPGPPGLTLIDLHEICPEMHALPRSLTERLVQDAQVDGVLHLDMQPDEDEWMMGIGMLNSRCNRLHTAKIAVSPRVSLMAAAENVKMLFVFHNLRNLQLRLDNDHIQISQRLVCAVAELLQLTRLHILHGSMSAHVDIAHWSSLRNLAELKLLPEESAGLGDAQLEQLTLLSTSLTQLSIRACPSRATSQGRWHLGSLLHVQELSCCPIGREPTEQDLQRIVDLPQLTQLTLGVQHASEVLLFSGIKLAAKQPNISLVVLDGAPKLSATNVLSVASWCLSHHLVSLTIGPLSAANPGDVLVMLQTLQQLRELKLQLCTPPDEHSSGTVDLLALSPLRHLTSLELLTSSRLYVPLDVKVISLASLAWPELAALRLSLAGKPELMPEALSLCDNFRGLTELQLFSPPDLSIEIAADQLPVSTNSSDNKCLFPGSGGWVHWAASGLGGLGRSASGSASSTGSGVAAAAISSSSNGAHSGSVSRSCSLPVHLTPEIAAVVSPLSRDMRQLSLVKQQQQQQIRNQWQQQQKQQQQLKADSTSGRASLACDEQQELPAAVDAFQRYKIKSPSRQYSADLSMGGTLPHQHYTAQHSTHSMLDSQASGSWSPGWLLHSFASIGSPIAAGAVGATAAAGGAFAAAADAAAAAASGSKGFCGGPNRVSDASSPKLAWSGRVMAACSGPAARHTYSGASSSSLQRHYSTPAYLASSNSAAAAAVAAPGGGTAAQPQVQHQGGSLAAPPGHELAMYRTSSRMMPLVLNYLPQCLRKLCLESFHLVVVGLPGTSGHGSHLQPQNSTGSLGGPPRQQQQQQQQHSVPDSAAEADVASSGFDAAAAAGLAAAAALEALALAAAAEPQHPAVAAAASDVTVAATDGPAEAGANDTPAGHSCPAAYDIAAASDSSGTSMSSNGSSDTAGAVHSSTWLQLPLQNLRHLELEECCVDDATMTAVLQACTGLRTLEVAGLEGLTNAGFLELTQLKHLTRLVIEAEHTMGITLRALDTISQLTTLKKLHWCSRDSMHGPIDVDALTSQLCVLTGLRQLALLTHQHELLKAMSGWKIVLQRKLPLCRLILWRELVPEEPWGDVPDEEAA